MIPLEYTCVVPVLLGCLRHSTLDVMKELTHHSWVKSHRHRLRYHACRGPTIKIYALLLWAATLIGLSGGAPHASVLCPSEICVALRKWRVQFTATLACIVLAFALDDRCAVDKPPLVDEVRPKVVRNFLFQSTTPKMLLVDCSTTKN